MARRSGSAGSGVGSTAATSPSARADSPAWCSAAPQLITRLRPSGSATGSWRVRSAYSSMVWPAMRHCQGWVLWTLGARQARATTSRRRACGGHSACRARRSAWSIPQPISTETTPATLAAATSAIERSLEVCGPWIPTTPSLTATSQSVQPSDTQEGVDLALDDVVGPRPHADEVAAADHPDEVPSVVDDRKALHAGGGHQVGCLGDVGGLVRRHRVRRHHLGDQSRARPGVAPAGG